MSGLPHILCVGAIVHDPHGRLLMVLRANAPARGTWSIPGGRLLPGESPEVGCAREVREETGLDVQVGELVGRVTRPAPGGGTYLIDDFRCHVVVGTPLTPVAGDDAADCRWVSHQEFRGLTTSPGLTEALRGWGALPQ